MLIKTRYEVKYKSTSEAAQEWSLKPRTVAKYCKKGLIPKAMKEKGKWRIPEGSLKPLSGKALKHTLLSMNKVHNHIAVGYHIDSFIETGDKDSLNAVLAYLELHGYVDSQDETLDIQNKMCSSQQKPMMLSQQASKWI